VLLVASTTTTTTTIAKTTTTIGHALGDGHGMHWGVFLVVVFTGATALGGLALWRASVKSHRLNAAVVGAGCPIVAGPTRTSWAYDGRQIPTPDPLRAGSRALAVRLRNVGATPELVTLDISRSRVWFLSDVTLHGAGMTIGAHGTRHSDGTPADKHTFMVGLTSTTAWSSRKKAWVRLTFDTADGFCVFRGRLRLWEVR
jgi:hypothetical protein